MLHNKPALTYCGLTVVLSHPSRFDNHNLLSGVPVNYLFNTTCLRPEFNVHQCDVRLKDDRSELLADTKCVLLLGEMAAKEWLSDKDNTLGEIRGSIFYYNRFGSDKPIPHIASFYPQDCVDLKDYESDNPLADIHSDDFVGARSDDDDEDEESGNEKRRHGITKRRNYGFWLMKDCEKVKRILKDKLIKHEEPTYIIYPELSQVCELLKSTKNRFLYFDCETDWSLNITCIGFSFDTKTIYVVPVLLPDYSNAYSGIWTFFQAMAIAIRDNIIVAHNGANFDFLVLAWKYRIAIRRTYDTMIAMHRCFPEAEKSLGHFISIFTNLNFHKDLGDVPYNNLENAKRTWQYCGLDVFSMAVGHESLMEYASKRPGLPESIQQANDSIRAYLTVTLQGIRYRQDLVDSTMKENDRWMTVYIRMLEALVGKETLKTIRGKSQKAMCGSNIQCVRYFHDLLGYDIIGRGKETKKGTKNPSLGKKNMYKLRLKYANPVIDISLNYRELAKESGSLKFQPLPQHTTQNEDTKLVTTESLA